jgi:hypothetical protein
MTWILVVLQVTAMVGGHDDHATRYGWANLGTFVSEKACVDASAKLAQATQGVSGVKNFQCLKMY